MVQFRSHRKTSIALVAAALLTVPTLGISSAKADAVADFYKGKDITILVGFSVGGSYGAYARLLAQHMGQYVPGNPNILTKHLKGGGGSRAAGFLYNKAPRDGTNLGFLSDSLAVAQLMFPKKSKYDASKMRYIGRLTPVNPVVMINKGHPVQKIADAKSTEVIISCSGRGSQTYMFPRAMMGLLDMKFKQVCGYSGSAPQTLAQKRGDVDAQSSAWISWKIRAWDQIQRGDLVPLVQFGLEREKDLPNIPLPQDLTDDSESKAIFKFLFAGGAVGRTLIAAPNVSMDRVNALKTAFQKTVKDPKFLADAKKQNANIDPISGDELDRITAKVLSTNPRLVKMASNIMKGYEKNCKRDCKKKKKKKKK